MSFIKYLFQIDQEGKVLAAAQTSFVPPGYVEVSEDVFNSFIRNSGGNTFMIVDGEVVIVSPPPPSKEDRVCELKTLMQNRLDAWARENSFDSIHAAASYAGVVDEDADPLAQKFVQDGNHAKAQMIKTWAAGLAMLNLYQAGQLDELTDEQFIAELPELSWEY